MNLLTSLRLGWFSPSSRKLSTVLLFFALSAACVAQQKYFPEETFGEQSTDHKWYSQSLKVLEEPSLWEMSKNPSSESYRFLWLRTFHNPIVVRLEISTDGTAVVTAKVGSGHAGFPYTMKGITQTVSLPVKPEQVKAFVARIKKVGFWEIPTNIEGDQNGMDGSEWVIEAVKAAKYHVVARWSPDKVPPASKRAVRELGLALAIDLAQMKIPEKEIY